MERNENRTGKGLSVKLCFRPSSVPQKAGRLYYQIIVRRAIYQYNSQHQIYETEWSKQTGLIITDALSLRGKELMTIKNVQNGKLQSYTKLSSVCLMYRNL